MTDSDIQRHIVIDFNDRKVTFEMVMSIDDIRANPEAWDILGKIMRADLPMTDVLANMSDMVRRSM